MFKHILVPTDGSKLSAKAVKMALQLAKTTGARVTGLYVAAPYYAPVYGEAAAVIPQMNAAAYKRIIAENSKRAFAPLAAAKSAGVKMKSVTGGEPWKAILAAARSGRCDVIVMASHGRSGLAGLILGSETAKVLTHSKTPVLVCR